MIYDTLDNLERYVELSDHFATAAAYILMNDLSELPLGRTAIDGDNVFVTVSDTKTVDSEEGKFEVHHNYMDLQMDLEGSEMFEVSLGEAKELTPYNEASDTQFVDGVASAAGALCEGRFVVFLTGEAHKPSLRARGCKKVRKAVFKILDDTINEEDESEDGENV